MKDNLYHTLPASVNTAVTLKPHWRGDIRAATHGQTQVCRAALGWKVLLWHEAQSTGAIHKDIQRLLVQFDQDAPKKTHKPLVWIVTNERRRLPSASHDILLFCSMFRLCEMNRGGGEMHPVHLLETNCKQTWSLNQIQLIWTQLSLSFDTSLLRKVPLQDVACITIFPNHSDNRISELDQIDE